MALFNRLRGTRHSRGQPIASTTPIYDRSVRTQIYFGLVKLTALIILPLALLSWYGHPALRTSYSWNGNSYAPAYYRCHYVAYDGMHRLFPERPGDPCPVVIFLPFQF